MSNIATTASLSIRLFANGQIEMEHKGDMSALARYLEDVVKIAAKDQAEEVAE